jgi:hypothetical protein
MIRKLFALVALFALACGGAPEDQGVDDNAAPDADNVTEIGQTTEAISIGNGGYGFTNATAQLRCAQPGVSGQVCFAAQVATKTVGYCFSGFPTTADEDEIAKGFVTVDGQTNWTFLHVGFPCDISIQNGSVAGGISSIEQFAKMTPTGTLAPLTSPPGVAHVNGTWTSFTKLSVVVDQQKLDGFAGASRTAKQRYVGGATAIRYIGLGSQSLTDAASLASFSRRTMPVNIGSQLTAGEVCRANNATLGNFNQINAVVQCGL